MVSLLRNPRSAATIWTTATVIVLACGRVGAFQVQLDLQRRRQQQKQQDRHQGQWQGLLSSRRSSVFPGTAKRWIHRQASGSESDETTSIPPEATDFHSMVDLITSEKSATVKRIQGLLTKRKKRTESSTTVVEGPRIVFDLLRNPSTRSFVQQVVV